jgi:hypothetical protein
MSLHSFSYLAIETMEESIGGNVIKIGKRIIFHFVLVGLCSRIEDGPFHSYMQQSSCKKEMQFPP